MILVFCEDQQPPHAQQPPHTSQFAHAHWEFVPFTDCPVEKNVHVKCVADWSTKRQICLDLAALISWSGP